MLQCGGCRTWGYPVPVHRVVAGQLRLRCRALGGLETELELHFEPRIKERLSRVEILRNPNRRKRKALEDLQARLVARLGPGRALQATSVAASLDGLTPWSWELGRLRVTHDYYLGEWS
jgi:hypothetical protein